MKTLKQVLLAALIIICLCAIASSIYFWHKGNTTNVVSKTEFLTGKEIPKVSKVKEQPVKIEKIMVKDKAEVAKILPALPETVVKDPNKQVTATTTIQPTENKTSVVSITDIQTGDTELLVKEEKASFFALENKKELGIRAGINSSGLIQSDIFGRWQVVRTGNLHWGIYGEVNSRGEGKAMLEATYRW